MYQVNFLPWRMARLQARYRFWRNLLIGQMVAIVMFAICITGFLHTERVQHRHEEETLLAQIMQLDTMVQSTKRLQAELQQRKDHHDRQRQIYRRTQDYLTLLNLLALSMPANCWLTQLLQQKQVYHFDAYCRDYAAINQLHIELAQIRDKADIQIHGIRRQDNKEKLFTIQARWWQEGETDE
ncbi:PilN domain-containing protein [Yersinia ruckeri]|uniref:PilN domain-containing protein n=1 Tax=Yersinia ruckeri TaxID=29486 RepID=UPI0005ABD6BD|nr:PilN domain-containing protein [Yersinia ruckeri]MCW6567046.1 PilN domain-containing protein [Yersinia ruckeri]